jgi:hypothetical protein
MLALRTQPRKLSRNMTSLNNLLRTTRISAGPKEKSAKSNPVIRDTSRAAGKQVKLKPIRKKPYMSEGSLSVPKIHSIDAPKSSLDVSSSVHFTKLEL